MSDEYRIEVRVLGPKTTTDTNYGPRTNRETFATLDVPIDAAVAWQIFRDAGAMATSPRLERSGFDADSPELMRGP